MTTHLGRVAAALALPVVLLFTATACGDSSEEKATKDEPTTSAPATDKDVPDSLKDVPDPRKDPEEFQAYLTDVYQQSGLSEAQASCMSKAFMDNVDLSKITDEAAISALMADEKLTEAITACM